MAGRIAQARRNVEEKVESILSLEGTLAAALLQAGASKGKLLRVIACAWDWLEQCPNLWKVGGRGNHDERLVALAIVRASAKPELEHDAKDPNSPRAKLPRSLSIALQHLGKQEEKPLLHELECRVVSLALAPGNQSQSLARAGGVATCLEELACRAGPQNTQGNSQDGMD